MKVRGDNKIIVEAAKLGSRKAFGLLVKCHQEAVRRFFLSQTLGNKALSDDLAQETFVKAWTHISKFRGEASVQTWLLRIAYNVLYDYHRGYKPTEDLTSPQTRDREESAPEAGLLMDLKEALAVLNDSERLCITLQLMEGESIEHIADITGLNEGTVKSQLSRGKQKVAQWLKENGYERE
ncbi:MAG: RNA polymerase sigma factor [Prevotella sp.]|nr:RNA polymerase sigma factor [Prevotella sp.]